MGGRPLAVGPMVLLKHNLFGHFSTPQLTIKYIISFLQILYKVKPYPHKGWSVLFFTLPAFKGLCRELLSREGEKTTVVREQHY